MELIDDRVRRVARRIIEECAAVREGEHVYIEGRLDAAEYLELLAFECERLGATALVVALSDQRAHRRLARAPRGAVAAPLALSARGGQGGRPRHRRAHGARRPGALRRRPAAQGGGRHRAAASRSPTCSSGTAAAGSAPTSRRRCRPRRSASSGPPSRTCSGGPSTWTTPSCSGAPTSSGPPSRAQRACISPRRRGPTSRWASRVAPSTRTSAWSAARRCSRTSPPARSASRRDEDQAEGRVVFDLAFWDGRRVEDLEVHVPRRPRRVPRRGEGVRVRARRDRRLHRGRRRDRRARHRHEPGGGGALRLHADRREDPGHGAPRLRRQRDARRSEHLESPLGHDDPAAVRRRSTDGPRSWKGSGGYEQGRARHRHAERHRHEADRGDAPCHGAGRGRRRRLRGRPDGEPAAGSTARSCSARRPRCTAHRAP